MQVMPDLLVELEVLVLLETLEDVVAMVILEDQFLVPLAQLELEDPLELLELKDLLELKVLQVSRVFKEKLVNPLRLTVAHLVLEVSLVNLVPREQLPKISN